MDGDSSFESVIQETSRLATAFLERELELIETLLQLARTELDGHDENGVGQAMNNAGLGLKTIGKYIDRVPPSDHERIAKQRAILARRFAALEVAVKHHAPAP